PDAAGIVHSWSGHAPIVHSVAIPIRVDHGRSRVRSERGREGWRGVERVAHHPVLRGVVPPWPGDVPGVHDVLGRRLFGEGEHANHQCGCEDVWLHDCLRWAYRGRPGRAGGEWSNWGATPRPRGVIPGWARVPAPSRRA